MSLLYHSSTRLIRPNLMEELQTTQKEILVAGGSSALIEFVISVYRFAIKICHGCNFWHSLFSLVLNLSCSVSPFKGCAELCIAYHVISQPSFTNYIRIFPVFISGWILPVKCSCRVMKKKSTYFIREH